MSALVVVVLVVLVLVVVVVGEEPAGVNDRCLLLGSATASGACTS